MIIQTEKKKKWFGIVKKKWDQIEGQINKIMRFVACWGLLFLNIISLWTWTILIKSVAIL